MHFGSLPGRLDWHCKRAPRAPVVGRWLIGTLIAAAAVVPGMTGAVGRSQAFTIELNDIAPMRVEWQRRFARGEMPLPGTPAIGKLQERLSERGLKAGSPIFIRIFKAESELEIWMRQGRQYVLFETYPICNWSGTLGPKLAEGDKQNPEGFYAINWWQMRRRGHWPKSINIGFPNRYDRILKRTGSYILVHGGCSSVGCFAMTNPVMDEIYLLARQAMRKGQKRFQLHIFPFRMTDKNMAIFASNKWFGFWQNLRQGYDNFERSHVPPRISVCGKRYLIEDANPDEIDALGRMRKLKMVSYENAKAGDRCVAPRPGSAIGLEASSRPIGPAAAGLVSEGTLRHASLSAQRRF